MRPEIPIFKVIYLIRNGFLWKQEKCGKKLFLYQDNVWFKKTWTNHSSDTVLQFVQIFLNQTLDQHFQFLFNFSIVEPSRQAKYLFETPWLFITNKGWLNQGLLNRWTSQYDWGITAGGLTFNLNNGTKTHLIIIKLLENIFLGMTKVRAWPILTLGENWANSESCPILKLL